MQRTFTNFRFWLFILSMCAGTSNPCAQQLDQPRYRIGDRWEFSRTTSGGGQSTWTREITEIFPDGHMKVLANDKNVWEYDEAMNFMSTGRVRKLVEYPLAEGRTWSAPGLNVAIGTMLLDEDIRSRVLGREDVEVPAGKFSSCMKIESTVYVTFKTYRKTETYTRWYCPDVKWIARETLETRVASLTVLTHELAESRLVKFTAGK